MMQISGARFARVRSLTAGMVAIAVSGSSVAQTQSASPQTARDAATLPDPGGVVVDDRAAPLAAGRRGEQRILSKNEAYNIARADEGRVGVRLGNDMSFRVGGN